MCICSAMYMLQLLQHEEKGRLVSWGCGGRSARWGKMSTTYTRARETGSDRSEP